MNPDRLKKIDDVFHRALEIAPPRRAAFLIDECGDDAALQCEVESLLWADEHAGEFIENAAAAVASELIANDRELSGQSVAGYKILSRLGSGGMGDVYLAEDARLGRKVALKLLPLSFAGNEERVRRFRTEARAASALNHPNILTVYETGRWRGREFIATEFVEGTTLATHLANGSVSLAAAMDIALQIASALSAAHRAGIVHRDIKPHNVMLRSDGLVKVLDFGIAKYTDATAAGDSISNQTEAGVVLGTTAYMSPEQARGLAVDARTDIWSLGVIVYEMVAAQVPFPGATSSDRIAAILEREPDSLSKRRPGIPEALEQIVGRALAKNPDQRYDEAADVAEDLLKVRAVIGGAAPFRFALPAPARARVRRYRRPAIGLAALLLTIAGAVGWLAYVNSIAPAAAIDSLAVLPLANTNGSSDTEYLSDGLTEALINSLSQLPDLKVMSRSSVFRYKGQEPAVRAVARTLGVRAVLTGRVAQRGDELSISVELVDARDGTHVWGEQYQRRLTDLMALQNEITRDVSRKLRSRLAGADERRLARAPIADPEAYRLYLKGRYHVFKNTHAEVQAGISCFRQAIAIDPSYALAYVGLADAYRVLALAGESPATEELPKAKAAAQRAIDIDETLAEAHAILGSVIFWYDWKWNDAEIQLKRALELDAKSVDAHEAYAHVLSYTGRHAEALAEIRRARELDPLNVRVSALEGAVLINAGQADEALVRLIKTLELEPDYWFARQYAASAYIEKGMFAEAIAESRQARERSGVSTRPVAFLGYALARSGKRDQARVELERLLTLSTARYVSPYNVAMIYHGLGAREETLAWLERGYQQREPRMVFLKVEPKWASLRGDSRFQALLQRVGFTR
jgi:eukaryotic-like serine/threonine-protein kinase